jgi:hypothetical protein
MNDNDIPIIVVFVYLDLNTRLLGLALVGIKAAATSFSDLRVQSNPRFVDKVGPVLDEQPQLVIGTMFVFACKVQLHHLQH